MRELKIDPKTGDLVRDGRGGLAYSVGAETAVLHQISIHFGGDWLAPEDGSRLHDLQYFTGDAPGRIKTEIERALAQLQRRGLISEIEVETSAAGVGRVVATCRYRDTRTGRVVSFSTKD